MVKLKVFLFLLDKIKYVLNIIAKLINYRTNKFICEGEAMEKEMEKECVAKIVQPQLQNVDII